MGLIIRELCVLRIGRGHPNISLTLYTSTLILDLLYSLIRDSEYMRRLNMKPA